MKPIKSRRIDNGSINRRQLRHPNTQIRKHSKFSICTAFGQFRYKCSKVVADITLQRQMHNCSVHKIRHVVNLLIQGYYYYRSLSRSNVNSLELSICCRKNKLLMCCTTCCRLVIQRTIEVMEFGPNVTDVLTHFIAVLRRCYRLQFVGQTRHATAPPQFLCNIVWTDIIRSHTNRVT